MRWPFSLDLRAIAVLRIAMGLLILLDLLIRASDIQVFYVADGVCPVEAMPLSHYTMRHLELYRQVGGYWGVAALFLAAAAFALSLTVGFYSRTSCALSWYLLASIQNRNIYLNDGGDLYLKVTMLVAMFLPLGARWSVDALRRPEWMRLPNRYTSLATVAVLVQICAMYLTAGVLKTDPAWWKTGDALYLALSIDQFSTGFAQSLLAHPSLLRALNFAALSIEISAAFLILCPVLNDFFRSLAVILLCAFHLGIASCMHLGLFMPICLAMLLVLVPTPIWNWLDRRGGAELAEGDQTPPESLPSGFRLSWPAQAFLSVASLFVLVQNAVTIPAFGINPGYDFKNAILGFGRSTALMQNWTLFAPRPFLEDGWFIMEGRPRGGGPTIDLMREGEPVNYHKPALVSAQFPNQRWRRWYQNMWKRYNPRHIPIFLRWEMRRWNAQHPSQPLESIRLVFVQETTQLPGLPLRWQSYELGTYPSEWLPEPP